MVSDDWELLGRIPRSTTDEWKITSGTYWNLDVVDIRLHHNDRPTKKGIRLNMEEIRILKQILEKVRDNEDSRSEENTERE
jgi:hypothetical protein